MKSFVIAGLLALSAHAVPAELEARAAATSTCNRDNCYRAVFATSPATRMAAARTDCAKYQTTTVTPCTTTIMSTPTVVVSAGAVTFSFTTLAVEKRDLCIATTSSGTVPSYASASCTASGTLSNRFASACSCSGFTSTTTTAPTPTSIIVASPTTSTSTMTQTVIASTPDPTSGCQQRLFSSGATYTTSNGNAVFTLSCSVNYQGNNGNVIGDATVQDTFELCADRCGNEPQCGAFDYYNVQIGGSAKGTCFLLKQSVPGTDAASQPNVDPRVDSGVRQQRVIVITDS